jgi:hypothetical protein
MERVDRMPIKHPGRTYIAATILALYLLMLFILQAIANDITITAAFTWFLLAFAILSSCILLKFANCLSAVRFETNYRHSAVLAIAVALFTFAVLLVCQFGHFPGGMSEDTVNQYLQASGESIYTNWHPVLHTLLFFTLPIKAGCSLGGIVSLQLLYFSAAFGYLIYVLHSNGCKTVYVLALSFYICLNPFIESYLMYPWKDHGLTIFAMLLMGYSIQTILSKGNWLKSIRNLILFSIVTVVCAFMRHNAVLFTAPLYIITLAYSCKFKKLCIISIGTVVLSICFVQGLYTVLDVQAPNRRTVETIGLPMTIICNVIQKNPESLPEETRQVMYTFANPETYTTQYYTGNFNRIKQQLDLAKLDQLSYGTVFRFTWQCFSRAPKESFEALAKLTSLVWGIDANGYLAPARILENNWGISEASSPFLKELVTQVQSFFSTVAGRILFGCYGLEILIMLVVAAVQFAHGRTSFFHILPLFCYDFGTMLLLMGPDYRFFLLNIPLWIPVIFLMLKDDRTFSKPYPQ